jgi:HK97 family phage portal protein
MTSEPIDWARIETRALGNPATRRRLDKWQRLHTDQGRTITPRKDGDHLVLEVRELSLDGWYQPAPPLIHQMATIRNNGTPWRRVSVRDALGVPAIFRAASLTSLTIGSLSMRGLRKQVEMAPEDRPQVIVRPDPNRTPRDFYRDTGWNLAGYGEAWWWVSSRDRDGLAATLYNVPNPTEVQVEESDDPIRPHITWRGKSTRDGTLRREDMRQLTFLPDSTGLRGVGPLQVCRAAASVAVEAQEWAANFYSTGGYPSILIKSASPLGGGDDGWSDEDQTEAEILSEAERLKYDWMRTAPNTPKVIDPDIEDVKMLDVPMASVQALDARNMQNGEAARMFGIPGVLLEFVQSGSSLTYQNLEGVFTQWVRTSLRPGWLEPIEQAMSDLLPRTTVARFDTETIEMPDVKTRYEVYGLGIANGIITPEIAQAKEGYRPGDVENATIPQPVFRPTIPRAASLEVRCSGDHPDRPGTCNRLLSMTGAYIGQCPRCKKRYPNVAA